MQLKELIEQLEVALEESGNTEVTVITSDGTEYSIDSISLDGFISISES